MSEDRRVIDADELAARMQKGGAAVADLQAKGIVTIFDKDGNVKAELDIVSIETQETDHAT